MGARWNAPATVVDGEAIGLFNATIESLDTGDPSTHLARIRPTTDRGTFGFRILPGFATDPDGTINRPSSWYGYYAPATATVSPVLEGIRDNGDGTFTATWGALNLESESLYCRDHSQEGRQSVQSGAK